MSPAGVARGRRISQQNCVQGPRLASLSCSAGKLRPETGGMARIRPTVFQPPSAISGSACRTGVTRVEKSRPHVRDETLGSPPSSRPKRETHSGAAQAFLGLYAHHRKPACFSPMQLGLSEAVSRASPGGAGELARVTGSRVSTTYWAAPTAVHEIHSAKLVPMPWQGVMFLRGGVPRAPRCCVS